MSDAQRPEPSADDVGANDHTPTDADGNPVPSDELLAEQALPAVYSRSPRMVRVIATAAAGGALLGALVGALLPSGFASGRGSAAAIMAFAGALIGALIAGTFVANGESREAKHVAQRKADAIDAWLEAHPESVPTSGSNRTPQPDSEGRGSTT